MLSITVILVMTAGKGYNVPMSGGVMKKVFFFLLLCLALSLAYAQNAASFSGLEISFNFTRQSGFSSNQYAVWIEDGRGGYVTTLFATNYTASGGWRRRPQSIPDWVRRSGLSSLNRREVDAFSGATPRTGTLSYRWDGRDRNGNPLPPGEYRVFLEATLRGENRLLCSAPFTLGSSNPAEAEVTTEYFGSGTSERGMIQGVRVFYRP